MSITVGANLNYREFDGTGLAVGHAHEDFMAWLNGMSVRLKTGGNDPIDVAELDDAGSRLLSVAIAAGVVAGNPSAADPVAKMSDLSAAISGISWQDPVEDVTVLDPTPLTPTTGQRWLINGVGAAGWLGHDYDIAEWSGTAWTFTTPAAGWGVWDLTSGDGFIFGGAGPWTKGFGMEVQSATTGVTVDRDAHAHAIGGNTGSGTTGVTVDRDAHAHAIGGNTGSDGAAATSSDGAAATSSDGAVSPYMFHYVGPVAAKAGLTHHAQLVGAGAIFDVSTAFTEFFPGRNLEVVASGAYDGGDLTIDYTDVFMVARQVVVTPTVGGTVVVDVGIREITHVVSANTVTLAETIDLNVGDGFAVFGGETVMNVSVDMANESPAAIDATTGYVRPTTTPNGVRVYAIMGQLPMALAHTHTAPAHTHTAPAHTHSLPANTSTDGAGACVVTDGGHTHSLPANTSTDGAGACVVTDGGHAHTLD